ncbi:D-alanyl-D-alanine carboxypeptidase family protein [Klenkia terrae]|uniref:D-alanyl-D-alanine carboxypeptidase family protein n=1 Tax=Klenkia terrae TaxID=1052259 RepID=A0ABU8E1B9_9ACTN
MPARSPAPARRPAAPRPATRTPEELARARARARAAARRQALAARAQRKADVRARRLAAVVRWTHRTGAIGGALAVVLVAAVVMSGVQPETPAAASVALDPAAAATQLRDDLTATTTDLHAARVAVSAAETELAAARAAQTTAQADLAAARTAVGTGAGALYQGTPVDRAVAAGYPAGTDPAVAGSLAVAAQRTGQQLAGLTVTAQSAARTAEAAAGRVATAEAVLAAARRQVAEVTTAARDRATALDPVVTVALAGLTVGPSSADQQAIDGAARAAWQARLAALTAAGITLPTAQQLRDGDLPGGLTPARDASGAPVPGVAAGVVDGAVVPVPSAEAAAAVSFAFAQLGTPYLAGGTSTTGVDCAGLADTVWTAAGTALGADLATQWTGGSVVPGDRLQAGDLVFGVDDLTGLDDVGISVGAGLVVTASAAAHQVVVSTLPEGATGIRVTVPAATSNALPPGTGTLPATCGGPSAPVTAAPVDPAWGGWSNGRIPTSTLCPIGGGQLLRCDAAAAYTALSQAYQRAFGTPLCITDSYRSFGAQQDAHSRKPGITAIPGTSNHGWGLAVDLCGGVNGFGTAQHQWMATYAGHFGWVHPDWAQATGENPEPWHWEFGALRS